MITQVNKDNATQYNNLYRKAEMALGLPEFTINTLEKYFYYLPDLMKLTGDDESKYSQTLGRRYAILPLDEAYFKINANQRTIEIPEDFKHHGLAVQGDETAEIIYFKINRYFDFMDLNNTEIYIQWQQGLEQNANSGLSQEWVRDIESDPDYLIFGWALDSTITEKPGTLKFSVRFIDWKINPETEEYILDTQGNRIISYSLSTKETTAAINPGLNLNIIETNISSIEDMISRRVKRARVVGADKADLPIFTLTLLDWIKQKNNGNETNEVNLNDGHYDFQIQAYSPDAGRISYEWYDIDVSKSTPLSTEDKYEPINASMDEPVIAETGHIYYIFDSKTNKYIPDTTITTGDLITDSIHFERYGYYNAVKAGNYIGVAKNDINFDSAVVPVLSGGQIDKAYGPIKIPGPAMAKISIAEDQKYNGYVIGVTSTQLSPIVTKGNDNDELSYQWYRQWGNNEKEKIDGATEASYEVLDNAQGYYILHVTAKRNNTEIVTSKEEEKPFLVTLPAMTPEVSYNSMTPVVGNTIIAEAVFADDYQNGLNKLSYQWCKQTSQGYEDIAGATSQTYIPDDSGNYKCKITNTYNGNSVTATSAGEVQVFDK